MVAIRPIHTVVPSQKIIDIEYFLYLTRHSIFVMNLQAYKRTFLFKSFTSWPTSRSAPKSCARSQQTRMLAPAKGAVWSKNYQEPRTRPQIDYLQDLSLSLAIHWSPKADSFFYIKFEFEFNTEKMCIQTKFYTIGNLN